ncbi:MAG TPA: hypothetical protein VJZ71_17200 [Phycisphaerae bacterium]|nr:hypothetical protein [Phycisphaerae bacterium]
MLKKISCLIFTLALGFVYAGCAENEYKTTTERQEQHESAPQDKSPGEMVVE